MDSRENMRVPGKFSGGCLKPQRAYSMYMYKLYIRFAYCISMAYSLSYCIICLGFKIFSFGPPSGVVRSRRLRRHVHPILHNRNSTPKTDSRQTPTRFLPHHFGRSSRSRGGYGLFHTSHQAVVEVPLLSGIHGSFAVSLALRLSS